MKKRTVVSRSWGLNPNFLRDKPLQILHVLLLERGYEGKLPEGKEEAIRILSREWRG